MDITKRQKRILLIAASIIAIFVIFWVFVYLPAKNSVKILKAGLFRVENKISALKATIGKDISLEKGLSTLEKQLESLESKFPANEEQTLRMVSNTAHKFGVDIISVKPQSKRLFLDKNEKVMKVEERSCQKMPISIVVRSNYRELGEFLQALREEIPHILTIEKLNISKGKRQGKLITDINLTMYLLIEERR